MTVEHGLGNRQTAAGIGPEGAVERAPRTQETFDRAQIAWLMQQAYRWGYESRDEEDRGFHAGYNARVAEENAAYPPKPVFVAGEWIKRAEQFDARRQWYASAHLPRPGDFKGRDNKQQVAA